MRIAFLSNLDYNLFLFRFYLMKSLVESGHDVYAVTPKGEYFEAFREVGITPVNCELDRKSINPFRETYTIISIYKVLKPLKLDILHTFTLKLNIYGPLVAKKAKIPIVINTITGLGSFYIYDNLKSKLIRFMIEKIMKISKKRVNAVIFQNKDDFNYFLKKNLVHVNKSYLIRGSGVDTNYFSSNNINMDEIDILKRELNIKKNEIVVTMIARAIWHKGIKEYYQAAKELSNKNIKFLYVGDTDRANPSSVDKLFLDSPYVFWLNFRKDIKNILHISNIFVLPSYKEGLPMAILEASSMQKTIIATDVSGCNEIIKNNFNGILIPPKNYVALVNAIKNILTNAPLRDRLSNNARKYVLSDFDINIVIHKHKVIYKKLLRNSR